MKDIHSFMGITASLSQFLYIPTNKCKFFFNAIKKNIGLFWDEECVQMFLKLKEYFSSPPFLLKPIPREDLYMYLVVFEAVVSVTLVREDSEG